MPDSTDLSDRELEILCLLATGASNKEIAQQLFISTNTVKVHLRNIFSKIGAASRTEAAMYAVSRGLVPGPARAAEAPDDEAADPAAAPQTPALQPAGAAVPALPSPSPLAAYQGWLFLLALLVIGSLALALVTYLRRPAGLAPSNLPTPTDTPRWQALAAMPTARFGLALAAYENQIYAMGGETAQGVTGAVERYDPASDSWAKLSAKPTPVGDVKAAVIGGKIYVPGGRLATGVMTDTVEVYDPRLDTWSQSAPLPVALSAYALVTFEGKLYLFGGTDGSHTLNTVYEYDPEAKAWSRRSAMPTGRAFAGAVLAGNKIYVIGGYDGKSALQSNDQYLPDADAAGNNPWKADAPLPEGRYGMGAASVADIILVLGGDTPGSKVSPLLEFLPASRTWQEFQSPLPHSWSGLGLIPLGTRLYILGGRYQDKPAGNNLAYQVIYTISIPVVR